MGKKDPTRRHDVLSDAAVNNITRQTRKLVEKTVRDIAISALDEVVKEYLSDAIDAAAVDAARAAAARVAPEIVFNAVIQLLSQTEDNNPHKVPQLLPFIDMASPTHRQLPLVRACLQADIPVWLHGEAGSGKSTMSEQVAQQLGLPYRSKSLGPATLEAGLLGFVDANGHYHTTGLREVYEATRANGDEGEGGVFLFDEIDNANSSVLTALNSIIGGDHGEFPDGRIERHQNTRFIAAANTIGRGATA
ncbi:AAA family ATPase, partial [Candidatus Saccharibacteria bacterium]|nr:AAA family ATPase [Candidatus Saccharibacteria bacterium]